MQQSAIMQKISIIAKLKQEKRALEARVVELEKKVVALQSQKDTAWRAIAWNRIFPGGLGCFRRK